MEPLALFFLYVTFVFFSGIKNGNYWFRLSRTGMDVAVVVMLTLCIMWMLYMLGDYMYATGPQYSLTDVFVPLLPVGALVLMYEVALYPKINNRVHDWENIVKASFVVAAVYLRGDWLFLLLAAPAGNMVFNWMLRYYKARYYTKGEWVNGVFVYYSSWECLAALWHTTAAEFKESRKGNWFTAWTLSGRSKILLGIPCMALAVLLHYTPAIRFSYIDFGNLFKQLVN